MTAQALTSIVSGSRSPVLAPGASRTRTSPPRALPVARGQDPGAEHRAGQAVDLGDQQPFRLLSRALPGQEQYVDVLRVRGAGRPAGDGRVAGSCRG